MAAYLNLNNSKILKELLVNKFNMLLDNQDRLAINHHSITSPHNEPQRSPGFVSPQNIIANSSGEFGLDETSTECKVSVFLKHNNLIRSIAVISFIYKLKKYF